MTRRLLQATDLDTGVIVREAYRLNGLRHRNRGEGPAAVWRDAATGVTVLECWLRDGHLHRDHGPAFIRRNSASGAIVEHRYYQDGVLHRDPKAGPARIVFAFTGRQFVGEDYFVRGKLHRNPKDGPARFARNGKTGQASVVEYWFEGEPLSDFGRGRRGITYFKVPPSPE